MFILGRIDGSHFLVYIKNDPTLPLNSQKTGPMAVGEDGGGGGEDMQHLMGDPDDILYFWNPKTTKPTF